MKQDNFSPEELSRGISRLFPREEPDSPDWQRVAAFASVVNMFSIISGGPGTGKTTIISKIITLLIEQAELEGRELRIAICAPTGKAAARLKEAISDSIHLIDASEKIKSKIPLEASTIHRLLGPIAGSARFRYNRNRPLALDLVFLDESSMVDLALMSKFLEAVPLGCRIILLGDMDQLSSVEAGYVFGDLCVRGISRGYSHRFISELKEITGEDLTGAVTEGSGSSDFVTILKKNYRFKEESGIGLLSLAVKRGDHNEVMRILRSKEYANIRFIDYNSVKDFYEILGKGIKENFIKTIEAETPQKALEYFTEIQILAALRKGPFGVEFLNSLMERMLIFEGCIKRRESWYIGRPVVINRNHYSLGLYNGDMGITFSPNGGGDIDEKMVYFRDAGGDIRKIRPFRLPEHESVYAMTIHKSQGSEFDRLHLILPGQESPLLSRELFYTSVTRAKEELYIYGTEDIIRAMTENRVKRSSGLRDRL